MGKLVKRGGRLWWLDLEPGYRLVKQSITGRVQLWDTAADKLVELARDKGQEDGK